MPEPIKVVRRREELEARQFNSSTGEIFWSVIVPRDDRLMDELTFHMNFIPVAQAEASAHNATVRRLEDAADDAYISDCAKKGHTYADPKWKPVFDFLESQLLPEGEDHAD